MNDLDFFLVLLVFLFWIVAFSVAETFGCGTLIARRVTDVALLLNEKREACPVHERAAAAARPGDPKKEERDLSLDFVGGSTAWF